MARPNTLLQYGRVVTSNQGSYVLTGEPAILIYTANGNLNGSESDGTNIRTNNERDFSTGYWGPQYASFTSGLADPSGSTEAATLVENTVTNSHRCYQLANFTSSVAGSAQVTFSVYAKAASRQYLILGMEDAGGNGFYANFDVSGGATGGQSASTGNGSFVSASVANGAASFYKCIVKGRISTSAVGSVYLFVSMASVGSTASPGASYAGDGTSGITIWRPKLTQP